MKKTIKILSIFAFVALVSCDSDDDGFYNRIYVDSENLVLIETGNAISLGERFIVNATIPNILPEPDFANPLNLRLTTGNAEEFRFSYVIEKQNGTQWEPVDMTGLHEIPPATGSGSGVAGYFVEASALYYADDQEYRYRGGVTLEETGTYRFTYTYNSNRSDGVELFSNSPGNNIDVKIFSASDQLNGDGAFIFTVN